MTRSDGTIRRIAIWRLSRDSWYTVIGASLFIVIGAWCISHFELMAPAKRYQYNEIEAALSSLYVEIVSANEMHGRYPNRLEELLAARRPARGYPDDEKYEMDDVIKFLRTRKLTVDWDALGSINQRDASVPIASCLYLDGKRAELFADGHVELPK